MMDSDGYALIMFIGIICFRGSWSLAHPGGFLADDHRISSESRNEIRQSHSPSKSHHHSYGDLTTISPTRVNLKLSF